MFRYAVLYNGEVFVEIPEDKFREGLIAYFKETNDVGEAFDRLKTDLDYELRRK